MFGSFQGLLVDIWFGGGVESGNPPSKLDRVMVDVEAVPPPSVQIPFSV